MRYFAYGSNMSLRRLRVRVPSACVVSVATLRAHELRFHKRGRDGSAKCDIYSTGEASHRVIGVLYTIDPCERHALDLAEGLGAGYDEKEVSVTAEAGEMVIAFTYQATDLAPELKPYHWYKQHVYLGALENRLPPDYLAMIAATEAIEDADRERRDREQGIYC
jgi:hypothetical protein